MSRCSRFLLAQLALALALPNAVRADEHDADAGVPPRFGVREILLEPAPEGRFGLHAALREAPREGTVLVVKAALEGAAAVTACGATTDIFANGFE